MLGLLWYLSLSVIIRHGLSVALSNEFQVNNMPIVISNDLLRYYLSTFSLLNRSLKCVG